MVADDGRLTIGAVVSQLREEFPDIAHSKLRFLESEGIVTPDYTESGYRKYSSDDVRRLRQGLALHRDTFRPWKVIKEILDALDRGETPEGIDPLAPRLGLVRDGMPSPEAFRSEGSTLRFSRRELVAEADVTDEFLSSLEQYGVVVTGPGRAPYDKGDLQILRTAAQLAAFGIDARHLRAVRQAADREVDLVNTVVAPIRKGRDADARGRADDTAAELAALTLRLHTLLVRHGLAR